MAGMIREVLMGVVATFVILRYVQKLRVNR
jgi:hypothetical protein